MEIADDLSDRALNSEEFIREKVIDLDRLVFVEPLGAGIVGIVDIAQPGCDDHVVDSGVRHLSNDWVVLYQFEIVEQRPAPLLGFAGSTIGLDYLLKRIRFGHQLTPWLGEPVHVYVKFGK